MDGVCSSKKGKFHHPMTKCLRVFDQVLLFNHCHENFINGVNPFSENGSGGKRVVFKGLPSLSRIARICLNTHVRRVPEQNC